MRARRLRACASKKRVNGMTNASDYFKDKVAVVTGAASGIGLALCEAMLAQGASKVVLADFNDDNLKREAGRLERAYPGRTLGLHCDVSQEAEVKAMIEKAVAFGGRIDLLFNNAGSGFMKNFDDTTNADWTKAFALNFYGALYGVRAVLPIMRRQGGGHVVNTISGIAFSPMPQQTMYSATKAALNALTLSLRYELWDENIRFTSATPGTTVTAIWNGLTPPPGAQTPAESARKILAGVARNERLVMGDDGDARGARDGFDPDQNAGKDQYFLNVARRRRAGEMAI